MSKRYALKKTGARYAVPLVFCAPGMARSAVTGAIRFPVVANRMTWRCKSSTGPARGTVSRTARVSTARWDLKEAAGKALARRTGIAYEAVVLGKKANFFKARYLHGRYGRICGGYKCEGRVSYPGRSVNLPCATSIESCWDGLAEVSRGHSRSFRPD